MRSIRRLVCSKAFALGVFCAYASVVAVFLTASRMTLYREGLTSAIHMREAVNVPLFITSPEDDDDDYKDTGQIPEVNSESLFVKDAEENKSFKEGREDIPKGTYGSMPLTSKSQLVAGVQDNALVKEGIGEVANSSLESEHITGDSLPQTAVTDKETKFTKNWPDTNANAYTRSVRAIGESHLTVKVPNPTLLKERYDEDLLLTKGSEHGASVPHLTAAIDAETISAKERLREDVNMTKVPMHPVDEANPRVANAAEPIAGKETYDTGNTATKAPVRVVEDSVVIPTLLIELRTDRAVTMEKRDGFKTWCTKDKQHGLDCRKRIPMVLGIGMERCGTTALSFFLRMHPDIVHAKPKDIYYWNHHSDRSLDWYRDHVPISSKYQVTMEYTPSYILSHEVPFLIKEALPDMKFIVMIRDPVERAMSHYLYMRHSRRPEYLQYIASQPGAPTNPFLGRSFEATVLQRNGDVFDDNAVIENALYETHLRRWLEVFPREQFLIIDEDVFRNDPVSILQQVEDFIGISKFFIKDYLYFDYDRGVFCQRVPTKHCSKRAIKNVHPPIQKHVLKKLRDYYHPYNLRLEKLLNRTFPWT